MRTMNRLTQLNLSERLGRLNHCYLVGCLILLGLLLRLPLLRLGLFRDEGSTYFDALPTTPGEVVRTVILCELNPPGFFLIMHQWMRWFGSQEIIFKLPALIFGLLLITATYGLGRVVGSRTTALLAALFATLAPAAVYYSQEARPYTLSALLSCLSVLLYCQALRGKRQIPYLLGFVVCAGLLVYVHYTGLLLVGSLATVTSLFWLRRTELHVRILPFIFAFGGIFLLFLPWLPTFLIHLSTEVPWEDKSPLWKLPYQLVDHLSYTIPLLGFLQKPFSCVVVLILGVRIGQFFYRTGKVSRFQNVAYNLPILTLEASLGLLTILEAVLVSNGRRYMFTFFPIAWVVYSYWLLVLLKYLDSQTEQLLTRLKLTYPMLLTKDYSGAEPVTIHLFSWASTQ